jgi:hypothetical protein
MGYSRTGNQVCFPDPKNRGKAANYPNARKRSKAEKKLRCLSPNPDIPNPVFPKSSLAEIRFPKCITGIGKGVSFGNLECRSLKRSPSA